MSEPTKKKFSQHDLGGVLKSAHQDENQALRITSANTSVPPQYSRVVLTYNTDNSVTNALFYRGLLAEIREVECVADVGGSLNNTYFTLQSENDESLYHVWYNVAGGGTDPAPANSVGIPVYIETNDPAEIVAKATEIALRKNEDFNTKLLVNSIVKIINTRNGVCTNSLDFGTGFNITTIQEGTEKLIKSVDVPYDGKTKYHFNTQEKKFEIFAPTDVQITGEVDIKDPNSIEISNTTIALKNVEETITLPNDIKRFTVKVRDGKAKLLLAFVAGGTATAYHTVPRGFVWESGDVDLADGTNIYVLSTSDNVVVETTSWRRI